MDMSSDINSRCNDPDEDVVQSIDSITSEFNEKIDLERYDDDEHHEEHEHEEEEEEEEEEDNDDDFTFVFKGDDDTPIDADNVFENGQIRQVFPLFDQKLLLDTEYEVDEIDRLPFQPPVDKIFVESPRGFPSSKNEQTDDPAAGPYCEWTKESGTGKAELTEKSNSTGFSKLWRLKDKVNRCNSDGRDTFVFLKSSDRTTTSSVTSASSSSTKTVTVDRSNGTFVKVNGVGGKSKVVKTKKAMPSAHEAYLRSKGVHTEEERRRSYLPYRPELMGFFTNVHGGLSKNVHPY